MNNFPTKVPSSEPDLAPSDDMLNVRQKQYAFIKKDGLYAGIQTGDVATCTGLVAIHRDFVFMMHVDVPWYHCGTMYAALKELRERCGPASPNDVKLYDIAGVTPLASLLASAAVAAVLVATYGTRAPMFVAALSAGLPAMALGVRFRLYLTLLMLGFNWPEMKTRKDAVNRPGKPGVGVNVRVCISGPDAFIPFLTLPTEDERDERFLPAPAEPKARWLWPRVSQMLRLTKAWGHWRLTRTPGSL